MPVLEAQRSSPESIVGGLITKADRIRALVQAGYLRTEIASILEIRYQHVRHVLERSGISLGKTRDTGMDAILFPVGTLEALVKRTSKSAATAVEMFPPSKLLDAGFIRIGEWTSVSEEVFVLDTSAPREPGVYAFVVDGVIRYVGLTQRGIRGRMAHYVRGQIRQRTSARIKGRILEALAQGSRVEVLVATPEPTEWNGLPVLTAPGLEAGLIRLIRPEWNMQGIG